VTFSSDFLTLNWYHELHLLNTISWLNLNCIYHFMLKL